MALGTDHVSTTTADVMIPEVWGSRLNDFYRASLKVGGFFEDWSEDLAEGGDVVHIPNVTEMTASAKVVGSEVVLDTQTETKIDLTIDTHYHVAFVIEDAVKSKIKKSYKAQEVYAKNAAYTVGATLEDALIALFNGFSQTVGASTTALNDSNIRAAIAYLDTANVPPEDRAFFLHPNTIWKQVMGIDKFTLLVNTGGADPVLKGQIGLLYGIPVIGTSRLGVTLGHRNGALAHKSALAFATANPAGMSGVNNVRLQTDYLLEYLGDLVVADLLFGVIENRDTSGVWIKASS
jgi:hypothetical protein